MTVPINFRLVASEIQYILENCEAGALIVQDELLGPIEETRSNLAIAPSNYIYFGSSDARRVISPTRNSSRWLAIQNPMCRFYPMSLGR